MKIWVAVASDIDYFGDAVFMAAADTKDAALASLKSQIMETDAAEGREDIDQWIAYNFQIKTEEVELVQQYKGGSHGTDSQL